MKKLIGILLLLVSAAAAQFPPLSPWQPFQYFGFESRIEANGIVVVYGTAMWKASIKLDASHIHNGDSSVVSFVTGPWGPTNCSDPLDSACQRHRAYTIQAFYGHKVSATADTNTITGVPLKCPCWTDFWYRYSNMTLRGAPYFDWESPATWAEDSTGAFLGTRGGPVTLARDSAGYISFEHVPTFDSAAHTYQISLANDPNPGKNQIRSGKWAHIQVYMDTDSANGLGIVWVNGVEHSRSRIRGMHGTLTHFHGGLYCSPAVATGTISNDQLFLQHVPDLNYAIHRFMGTQE
jgi:hypothetical protein